MKSYKFKLFFLLFFSFYLGAGEKPRVCLNMIVKNEKEVICRCLESAKPLIDYWIIVDTGSTDGTQDIIKNFMKDIPGELHEHPWKNFEYNRNHALELAKVKGDYILIVDADDVFEYPKDFHWPNLTHEAYFIKVKDCGTKYDRLHLVKSNLDWKWMGVLHEAIGSKEAKDYARFKEDEIIYHRIGGGSRSKDPNKFLKDAQIFEEALEKDPTNSRYMFYLAQSYLDAMNYPKAIEAYEKRTKMGGWEDEIFWSKYKIASMKESLNKEFKEVAAAYEEAYRQDPKRAEPLYGLATYYRNKHNYAAGYNAALKGLHIQLPASSLFVVEWIYDYGLLLEFSICAYYIEKYTESWLSSYLLLGKPNLPSNIRECVNENLKWINAKFADQAKSLSLIQNTSIATFP